MTSAMIIETTTAIHKRGALGTRRASGRRGSAPLQTRGFCLQTAKNFDVGEQVSQTWCVWTPPKQARFRHVRVGKMHRDERGEACHCVKMPLQRLHSCVLEEMSDNKCTVERERETDKPGRRPPRSQYPTSVYAHARMQWFIAS